ncbi:MAG: aldo/keto reductase [Nitrosopumilus sp. D6]|nr:MAG: aldo/keto reductase [Nitrosopumilus sp. D6]
MIPGSATAEGTAAFARNSGADAANFKKFAGLTLSNVGMGTYLGEPDSATDDLVCKAIKQSVSSGVNVIDTAINYRAQKAERAVGRAISEMIQDESASRDQLFICSKNGYVTNDADVQLDFWGYVKKEYTDRGVIKEGDVTSGYHCMTAPYLSDQLDRSLKNLGLESIDLMYLHNSVEGQVRDVTRERYLDLLESAFEMYEQKRRDGKIKFYGMATWECFRVPDDDPQHLLLEDAVDMAKRAGGDDHGFRFVQLPFNMYYDQAMLGRTQKIRGERVSALDASAKLGIGVFTSVPFMQGRLLQGSMPEFGDLPPALRALQFIRSAPGVIAPLAGQKSQAHVSENLKIMKIPPMSHDELDTLVKKFTG